MIVLLVFVHDDDANDVLSDNFIADVVTVDGVNGVNSVDSNEFAL